ncbi:TPA: hypothetical protein ACLFOW_002488 [Yersinia enterocolitica]|nr:hypothetical protein [Yersinia enterocolitica]
MNPFKDYREEYYSKIGRAINIVSIVLSNSKKTNISVEHASYFDIIVKNPKLYAKSVNYFQKKIDHRVKSDILYSHDLEFSDKLINTEFTKTILTLAEGNIISICNDNGIFIVEKGNNWIEPIIDESSQYFRIINSSSFMLSKPISTLYKSILENDNEWHPLPNSEPISNTRD